MCTYIGLRIYNFACKNNHLTKLHYAIWLEVTSIVVIEDFK